MKTRRLLFRVGTVALLLAVAACMMFIGRGHTLYFDNKKLEYEGTTYDAVRRINVFVNGEQVAKLSAKERGMASFTGGGLSFSIEVQREKGGDTESYDFTVNVPYGQDGTIVNLIGMIEGLPEAAWTSEFIPAPEPVEEDEDIPGEGDGLDDGMDDFEVGGDI
ncbi:MAG: hypothetical protein IJ124_12700 [Clostridia bacterium]|nr:hypothetical protein [Clostridia bacterium]